MLTCVYVRVQMMCGRELEKEVLSGHVPSILLML